MSNVRVGSLLSELELWSCEEPWRVIYRGAVDR